METPFPKRLRSAQTQRGARASRRGASTMDYFLGPGEMLRYLSRGGANLAPADLALHTTEATLALQNAGTESTTYKMRTRCAPLLTRQQDASRS